MNCGSLLMGGQEGGEGGVLVLHPAGGVLLGVVSWALRGVVFRICGSLPPLSTRESWL